MWSLQISKDLLEYIQSRSLSSYTNINAFDFSTLYITIPHSTRYGISVSQMSQQLCCLSKTKSNTTDATSAAGTAYLSSSHPGFSRVHVAQSLVLCVMFCINGVIHPELSKPGPFIWLALSRNIRRWICSV
jgi:hypothetical protein